MLSDSAATYRGKSEIHDKPDLRSHFIYFSLPENKLFESNNPHNQLNHLVQNIKNYNPKMARCRVFIDETVSMIYAVIFKVDYDVIQLKTTTETNFEMTCKLIWSIK